MKSSKLSKSVLSAMFFGLVCAPCAHGEDVGATPHHANAGQATAASHTPSSKTGNFYIGFSVGGEHVTSKRKFDVFFRRGVMHYQGNTSANGAVALVSGGYQITWPRVLVAVEAFLGVSTAKKNWQIDHDLSSELSKNFLTGVISRVGLPGGSVVPYLTTGVEVSRFSLLFHQKSQSTRKKESVWTPAFLMGGGLEKPLTPRTSLRLDYTLSLYKTARVLTPAVAPLTPYRQGASKTHSHRVTLGLFYKF